MPANGKRSCKFRSNPAQGSKRARERFGLILFAPYLSGNFMPFNPIIAVLGPGLLVNCFHSNLRVHLLETTKKNSSSSFLVSFDKYANMCVLGRPNMNPKIPCEH